MKRMILLKVNGKIREDLIDDATLLIDSLRDQKGLTGTKQGCDGGECEACTVLVNGRAVPSCVTLAARCEGAEVETIEGQAQAGRLSALQRAFHENLGTQCGFCTPGMIMAAEALLLRDPDPDDATIRAAIAGNICRCTGYVKIVESVRAAAAAMAEGAEA